MIVHSIYGRLSISIAKPQYSPWWIWRVLAYQPSTKLFISPYPLVLFYSWVVTLFLPLHTFLKKYFRSPSVDTNISTLMWHEDFFLSIRLYDTIYVLSTSSCTCCPSTLELLFLPVYSVLGSFNWRRRRTATHLILSSPDIDSERTLSRKALVPYSTCCWRYGYWCYSYCLVYRLIDCPIAACKLQCGLHDQITYERYTSK